MATKNNALSDVDIKRSGILENVVRDLVTGAGSASSPKAGFFLTPKHAEFASLMARSRLYEACQNKLRFAHQYAEGVTDGLGGDAFQRFLGRNASWSKLAGPTVDPQAASLVTYQTMWMENFAIDFVGVLVPVHSSLEGRAVLLFKWTEDDLMPTSSGPQSLFLACLLTLAPRNRADTLAEIKESLTCEPQLGFCELLPRRWVVPLTTGLAINPAVRYADELLLSFEEVSAFGKKALFFYDTYAVIDSAVLGKIEKN